MSEDEKVFLAAYRFPIDMKITKTNCHISCRRLHMTTRGTLKWWSPVRLLVSPFWSRAKEITDIIDLETGNLSSTTAFVVECLNDHEEGPKFDVVSGRTSEINWVALWTYGMLVKEVLLYTEEELTGIDERLGFAEAWNRDFIAASGAPDEILKGLKWVGQCMK